MKPRKCYLVLTSLDRAVEYPSQTAAIRAFRYTADELFKYGQRIEATLHFANSREELVEYPDYTLALGPNGGLKMEKA